MRTAGAASIAELRARMERVDAKLVSLLAHRQQIAQQLVRGKQEQGLPVVDLAREAAVLRRAGELARDADLDEDAVKHIFWCLIDLSRRVQLQATE